MFVVVVRFVTTRIFATMFATSFLTIDVNYIGTCHLLSTVAQQLANIATPSLGNTCLKQSGIRLPLPTFDQVTTEC